MTMPPPITKVYEVNIDEYQLLNVDVVKKPHHKAQHKMQPTATHTAWFVCGL